MGTVSSGVQLLEGGATACETCMQLCEGCARWHGMRAVCWQREGGEAFSRLESCVRAAA